MRDCTVLVVLANKIDWSMFYWEVGEAGTGIGMTLS